MRLTFVLATVWLFLAIIFAFKIQMDYFYAGHSPSWLACLVMAAMQWSAWAGVSLLIAKVSRSLLDARRFWARFVIVHFGVGLTVSLVMYILMHLVAEGLVRLDWLPEILPGQFSLLFNGVVYFAVVAVDSGLYFFRHNTQLELQKTQLQAELTSSQLQTLKMQLRPHFLFNVLNTITMLIETDPPKAARVTALLGDLLRTNLLDRGDEVVPLSREIALIEKYLQIEKIRFEDRINVVYEIDPNALNELLPAMLLQPIVENAMCHGFGNSISNGELKIKAACEQQRLRIEIVDSGNGECNKEFNERIGLGNTRSRLEKMYGQESSFNITSQAGGSTHVVIQIPLVGNEPGRLK